MLLNALLIAAAAIAPCQVGQVVPVKDMILPDLEVKIEAETARPASRRVDTDETTPMRPPSSLGGVLMAATLAVSCLWLRRRGWFTDGDTNAD